MTRGGETGGPPRTAVILAAGLGTRIAGEHSESPKGFLVAGEKAIIEESVDKLVAAGIERVVIVTGHLSEHYDEFSAYRSHGSHGSHGSDGARPIETVHNSDYADSGSMYSLYCARHLIDSDFLLLESDIVYEKRALEVLLEGDPLDAVLMSGPTQAGDEVYIQAPQGLLQRMSKDSSELRSISGELVGICRVSLALYKELCSFAERRFEETLHVAYETDALVAAAAGWDIHCPLVEDLLWGEIDDEQHLKRVRGQVHPAIERKDIERKDA